MNLGRDLPLRSDSGWIRVVVECPAGSRVKYCYRIDSGTFEWSRLLPLGVRFPYDFGFLPGTVGEDGDALDALVLTTEATYPGVIVPSRVIGALRVEQQRVGEAVKRNDRLVAVPFYDPASAGVTAVDDLPARVLAELEAFFQASLALTGKTIALRGWADPTEAEAMLSEGERRFAASLDP